MENGTWQVFYALCAKNNRNIWDQSNWLPNYRWIQAGRHSWWSSRSSESFREYRIDACWDLLSTCWSAQIMYIPEIHWLFGDRSVSSSPFSQSWGSTADRPLHKTAQNLQTQGLMPVHCSETSLTILLVKRRLSQAVGRYITRMGLWQVMPQWREALFLSLIKIPNLK